MGRASKIGAHIGPLGAGQGTARVAGSLRAPISRPMAAPAQSRYAARSSRLTTHSAKDAISECPEEPTLLCSDSQASCGETFSSPDLMCTYQRKTQIGTTLG